MDGWCVPILLSKPGSLDSHLDNRGADGEQAIALHLLPEITV